MPSKYEKIGEGAYGCVIEPSLHCASRQPASTYKNKVAKVMLSRYAKKEMEEYALITKADPKKQYYLGKPKTCKIKNNAQTRKIIKTCKRGEKYLKDMRKTSLLIMENGGINLSMLAKDISNWKDTTATRAIVKNILFEFMRMFEGVQVFLKHDILHHDLKPQNIVYNKKTGRMNFIDFGLMRKRSISIRDSRNSTNWITEYAHWSYPLETQFLNRDKYMNFANKSVHEKLSYIKHLVANMHADNDDKFTDAFYVLCSYIVDPDLNNSKKEKDAKDRILKDYGKFLIEDVIPKNYEVIMKRSFDTYDTYGLGMSLSRLNFAIKRFIPKGLYNDLNVFSYDLLHPNVLKRLTVGTAIAKYGEILKTYF